jgi:hypothetical protein
MRTNPHFFNLSINKGNTDFIILTSTPFLSSLRLLQSIKSESSKVPYGRHRRPAKVTIKRPSTAPLPKCKDDGRKFGPNNGRQGREDRDGDGDGDGFTSDEGDIEAALDAANKVLFKEKVGGERPNYTTASFPTFLIKATQVSTSQCDDISCVKT